MLINSLYSNFCLINIISNFRYKILCVCCFLLIKNINAQTNLITNPGFENNTICPSFGGQINLATGWNNVNLVYGNFTVGTPDYFHTCGSGTTVPPNTFAGQCNPHTGNAMAALVMYNSPYPGYREYMSTPLSCPMTPGNTYTVSFWTTNGLNPISRYTIKNIGIHFSTLPLTQSGYSLINVVPQVEVTTMLGSTAWVNYTFTVIPTANWQHLTIGAFRTDALNTPASTYSITTGAASVYANYFFDDIEVLGPATPTIGLSSISSPSICLGQSAVITPVGSVNYSITPGNVTGQNFTVSPLVSTTYTISSITSGCGSASTTAFVFVNPTPVVSGSTVNICSGQSAALTASPAIGYTWSPSGANTQSITVQPMTSTNYSVMGNNGICTFSATTTVSVMPTPTVSVTGSTLCAGAAATLVATGANAYTWQPSGLNGPGLNIQPLMNSTYTVTGSNGVCTASAVASVTVIPTPTVTVSSATICAGQTATLSANSTSGYTWSPSGATIPTIQVQPPATSVYTVLSSNGTCSSSATATVSVLPLPLISVATQTVCAGQTGTLTGSGATSYTWQPSGFVSPTITVQSPATTIYSVTGSNGACTSGSTGTLVVLSVPLISTTNASVCAGASVTLQASGAATYTWSPVNMNGSVVSVQPLSNTTYTVSGSNGACTSSAVVTVTVIASPALSVTSATICAGQTATLTASSTSGYTWSPSGAHTPTLFAQPSGSVVYTVSSSDNTCTSVAQASVTVLPFPTLSIGNPTVCSGQVSTLNASGATTYTWMPQNISASSVTVQLVSNTNYTITGSNGSCLSSTVIPVNVHSLPALSVNSGTICSGQSQLLSSNGALTYTWQPTTGLNNTNGSTVTANPISTTDYTVSGSNAFGCIGFAVATVSVIPSPSLAVTATNYTICNGTSVMLNATGAAAGSYTWSSLPSGASGSAMPLTVSPTVTTVYEVTATNGIMPYVCSSTKSITIQVSENVKAVTCYADPVCLGNSTILCATGGSVYHWQPSAGLNHPNDSVTKASPLVTTIYTVAVSKYGNCPGTATVQVVVNPVPYVYAGRDTVINIDEFAVLSGSGNVEVGFVPLDSGPLSCNFCSQLAVYPKENTCYLLKGTNTYGCTGMDTVCVMVTKDWEVFIPNAFTPNGDGYNEVFIPVGYGLTEIRLTIFDRWGSLIFRSHGEMIGWDGMYKGKLCQQDVYIYQAEIVTMAGNTVKRTGHVTLLPRKR